MIFVVAYYLFAIINNEKEKCYLKIGARKVFEGWIVLAAEVFNELGGGVWKMTERNETR